MKIDIQFLLNICTFITSLIGLLTLFEMVKQRHASMMPNILVQSPYSLTIKNERGYYSPYRWLKTDDGANENIKEQFPFCVDLVNVGLGTAINIEYEWCFETKFYIEKNLSDIQYNEEKNIIYLHNKKQLLKTNGLKSIKYRIPYAQTSEKFQIEVLKEFQCFFSAYLFSISDVENSDLCIDFMKDCCNYEYPLLIIKYNDISGKSYKKSFKFNMQATMISEIEACFTLYINEK